MALRFLVFFFAFARGGGFGGPALALGLRGRVGEEGFLGGVGLAQGQDQVVGFVGGEPGPFGLVQVGQELGQEVFVVGGFVGGFVVGEQDLAGGGVVNVDEGGGDLGPAELVGGGEGVVPGEDVAGGGLDDQGAVLAVVFQGLGDEVGVALAGVVGVGGQGGDGDGVGGGGEDVVGGRGASLTQVHTLCYAMSPLCDRMWV